MIQNDSVAVGVNIRYQEFENVSAHRPNFNEFSPEKQRLYLARCQPEYAEETHNIALNGFLEYLVDDFDPNQSPTGRTIDQMAIGSDDTAPTQSDTTLGSKIGSFAFSNTNDAGTRYEVSTVLDETQANGNTIAEIALETSGNVLFNRALVGPRDKTDSISITIDATLGFEAI